MLMIPWIVYEPDLMAKQPSFLAGKLDPLPLMSTDPRLPKTRVYHTQESINTSA